MNKNVKDIYNKERVGVWNQGIKNYKPFINNFHL